MKCRYFLCTSIVSMMLWQIVGIERVAAQGFRNPPEGARAVGAYGGYLAFVEDADAAIHNPANLVDVERQTVQINLLTGYGRNTFRRDGVREKTRSPYFAIPGFAAAIPIEDRFAMGLAMYVPYGRSVEWKRDGYFAQRGLPYQGSMTVVDVTPSLAARVNKTLSAAIGLDIYHGEVHQDSLLFGLGGLGIPDGTRSRLEADGSAIGWNAALTLRLPRQQRIAATIRSPFSIKYEGDNELEFGLRSKASTRIQYPTIVSLGYGIALTENLVAEVNGEWLEFSRYDSLTIRDALFGDITVPVDQKDTWTAGIGVQWTFRPEWTLRAGYKYLENPTPDSTYGPLTPDEDQGVLSVGIGFANERHAIDLGYAYGLFDGRRIPDTNPAGGTYDYNVHLLSFSYGITL